MLTAKEAKRMTETVRINLEESIKATVLPRIEEAVLEAVRKGEYFATAPTKQNEEHTLERLLKSLGYSTSLSITHDITISWR